MDRALALRLETYNPWLLEPTDWPTQAHRYLPRQIVPRKQKVSLEPDQVELVIGPRQAGKSTLVWLQLCTLARPPLLVNLDDPLLQNLCQSGAHFLVQVKRLEAAFSAFFFEEVQHLEEAGLFLKSLADLKPAVPIVATGSSSYHLRSRTRESLAGRAHRLTLLPFSLDEVVGFATEGIPSYRHSALADDLWQRMAVYGGYPRVWLEETERKRQALLLDLMESLIMRDASDLYRVRRPDAFRAVLRLAATQIGMLVNQAEYASLAGINASTVREYLAILEESHVVQLLRPFLGGRRAEITSAAKLFLLDNGLRNHLHGGFEPFENRGDRGALLENFVFGELAKWVTPLDEIRYWRTRNGAEVDFVIQRHGKLVAVEVKAKALRRTAVSRSARSFIQAYRPEGFIVVNTSLEQDHAIGETPVHFRQPHTLVGTLQSC